ncbi:MAG: phosphoribosylanthranilate isomerase [Candidatus Caenarcaniphilales bacterium]|nr:phosphoribosylanthranilate isomerase [Candidatus Caenarcaniphilales bacterium]
MFKVKICGITNANDALLATELGANALGFIFVENSPRFILRVNCRDVMRKVPSKIDRYGVFQNHSTEEIVSIMDECEFSKIQLHGDEDRDYIEKLLIQSKLPIIKAYRLNDGESNLDTLISQAEKIEDYVEAFLLDGPGNGKRISKDSFHKFKENFSKPIILAGGISPSNIGEIINEMKPDFVDVCSGVEKTKGKKSSKLMKEFFTNCKEINN